MANSCREDALSTATTGSIVPAHPRIQPLRRPLAGLALLTLVVTGATATAAPLPFAASPEGSVDGGVYYSFERSLNGWQVMPGSSIDSPVSCRGHLQFHPLPLSKDGECFLSTLDATGLHGEVQSWYRGQFGDNNRGLTGQGYSPNRGVIESPRFTVTHPTLSMLVAGGGDENLYLAVCSADATAPDGCNEVARVLGDDTEWFNYKTVDLSEQIGTEVFLRLVDDKVRGWSHLAVDNVRANVPAMPREFQATHGDGGAAVSWREVAEPGITGYDLYRRQSTGESAWPAAWTAEERGGFTKVNDAPLTGSSVVDAAAQPDTAYWYRVVAVDERGLASEANMTYLRPELDPGLLGRGDPVTYRGEQLSGIVYPVGPIGYGGIQHLGDGTRNLAWIFNIDGWVTNSTWGRRESRVPHSFFALRAQRGDDEPVVRALQTVPEGPFGAVQSLEFSAQDPVGTYTFQDEALPVQVSLSAESPTVPGNLRDSAIPTAIYTMEVTNPSRERATVSLLASQQNAVGFDAQVRNGGIDGRRHQGYGQNANDVTTGADGAHLHMTGCTEGDVLPVGLRCNGGMALSMLDEQASGTASWSSLDSLHADFAEDGTLAGPQKAESPEREVTVDGALATTFELAPGEARSVPVVFSWYIPTSAPREFGGLGVEYSNHWDSARDVHAEVLGRLPELRSRNRLFADTVYDSNLPRYVLDRLTSQISTMRTPTVFTAKNGFAGGYEGHGCCAGMPGHVWQYAQLAPRLWPEIDTRWQSQWLDLQTPDGALPNRHGIPIFSFDGQAGVILGAYRSYTSTADADWLAQYWPKIKRAMDYLITHHDLDEDGILTGSQPMTLDQRLSGTSSWLGSMYLAATRASARLAEAAGATADAQRYEQLFQTGRVNQEQLLFNGDYYGEKSDGHLIEGVDATATATGTASYGNGLIADMLLGQWWASMLGLGDIYDPENMTRAMRTLYAGNFKDDFLDDSPFGQGHVWRAHVRPTDAGLRMMTWPKGDRPHDPPRYHDEVWTGTEYSAAATMIQRGLVDEGLRIVRAAADRYDGRLRRDVYLWNCGAVDGGGNPFGDDECGKWYARAMSSWSVLLALQGFEFEAAEQRIAFAPQWRPHDHRSFFSAGNSWGTFEQHRAGNARQTDTIAVKSGTLSLRTVQLATGGDLTAHTVTVTLDGRRLDGAVLDVSQDVATVQLPGSVDIGPGQTLRVELTGRAS